MFVLDFVHRVTFLKIHNVSETGSASVFRWPLLCWVPQKVLVSITGQPQSGGAKDMST